MPPGDSGLAKGLNPYLHRKPMPDHARGGDHNSSIQRSMFRWIHIIFSIPILGYTYSPFEKLPGYAPATRFFFLQ